ncbi:MAG: DUF2934 domain-containing protein [Acidobacteriota bacterium]
MAETVKKTKAPAKPRKAAAKKSVNNVEAIDAQQHSVSHDDVARLAHSYWKQRGGDHGHHEDDWYRAEQELRGKAS